MFTVCRLILDSINLSNLIIYLFFRDDSQISWKADWNGLPPKAGGQFDFPFLKYILKSLLISKGRRSLIFYLMIKM